MYIYFNYPMAGNYVIQGFQKLDKAVDYVVELLESYCGIYTPSPPPVKKKKVNRLDALFEAQPIGQIQIQGQPVQVQAQHQHLGQVQAQVEIGDDPFDIDIGAQNNNPIIQLKRDLNKSKYGYDFTDFIAQAEITKKEKTIENVLKLIELYEDYSRSINGEAYLHTLQETTVEGE